MTLGQICQKRKAFLRKNARIGHRSISLQSVCTKITSSRTMAMERRSAQKLHSSAIALLQIFDLIFAGSRVATRFCDITYVPYLLRTFYSSVAMLPPWPLGHQATPVRGKGLSDVQRMSYFYTWKLTATTSTKPRCLAGRAVTCTIQQIGILHIARKKYYIAVKCIELYCTTSYCNISSPSHWSGMEFQLIALSQYINV